MESDNTNNSAKPRRRSLTSLTLNWIADRVRKQQRVKEAVSKGSYKINSLDLAKTMVNKIF